MIAKFMMIGKASLDYSLLIRSDLWGLLSRRGDLGNTDIERLTVASCPATPARPVRRQPLARTSEPLERILLEQSPHTAPYTQNVIAVDRNDRTLQPLVNVIFLNGPLECSIHPAVQDPWLPALLPGQPMKERRIHAPDLNR